MHYFTDQFGDRSNWTPLLKIL